MLVAEEAVEIWVRDLSDNDIPLLQASYDTL